MARHGWVIAAVSLFVTALGQPAWGQETSSVVVAIHDSAGLEPAILAAARARAERVFATAGVSVDWDGTDTRRFRVQVLLRPRNREAGPGKPRIMGMALAAGERSGVLSLYFDAVRDVARRYGAPLSDVLGIALAHELGHVLLPPPSHSPDGIMQASWEGDDIRHALLGDLAFNAAQAEQIRLRLRRSLGPAVLEGDGPVKDGRVRP